MYAFLKCYSSVKSLFFKKTQIPFYAHLDVIIKKKEGRREERRGREGGKKSVGKNVEKLEPTCIAGGM